LNEILLPPLEQKEHYSTNGKQHMNQTAADILARAFLHYPLMPYAFEGLTEQERLNKLQKLFTPCVSTADVCGDVLVMPDKQGALIWLEGKYFPLTLGTELRYGMWRIPFVCGIKPTLRLMRHDADAEGWIGKHAAPKMGYIWNIGVLAEARGKGYSRQMIDAAMQQMFALRYTECWLKTEDAKNVTIYQKLGFTLMNEMTVKSSGIKSWAMRKMIK
jgi:ribosomal protein S18 acetylase RimI-like enzyme